LINPTIFSLYPIAAIWIWSRNRLPLALKVARIGSIILVCGATISPWVIRNYLALGRLSLKSNLPLELKIGNNPMALGNAPDFDWMKAHPSISALEFAAYRKLGESRYLDLCWQQATAFIRENPDQFAQLSGYRVVAFWIGDAGRHHEWKGNLHADFKLASLKAVFHLLPLPLALPGILLWRKKNRDLWLMLAVLCVFPVPYYVTHTAQRYRFPVEPFLILFIAVGVWALSSTWFRRRLPHLFH
jgi:hypothetical protein